MPTSSTTEPPSAALSDPITPTPCLVGIGHGEQEARKVCVGTQGRVLREGLYIDPGYGAHVVQEITDGAHVGIVVAAPFLLQLEVRLLDGGTLVFAAGIEHFLAFTHVLTGDGGHGGGGYAVFIGHLGEGACHAFIPGFVRRVLRAGEGELLRGFRQADDGAECSHAARIRRVRVAFETLQVGVAFGKGLRAVEFGE